MPPWSDLKELASLRFVVWGAGGHGKVVADLIRASGGLIAGFIDRDTNKLGQVVEAGGARVCFAEKEFRKAISRAKGNGLDFECVALAIGDNKQRYAVLRLVEELESPALVHPSAVVSPSAEIARAAVVFANAVINASARIGSGAIVNSGAIVEHDCVMADASHLSPGAILSGGVQVGARSWIGAGAVILPGVEIGNDVTVGAGAVVLSDVLDGMTVAGVPAKQIQTTGF